MGSLLWHTARWQKIQDAIGPSRVTVDFCHFGEPYRKRTTIPAWSPTNTGFLDKLSRRFPGTSKDHVHADLSGWGWSAGTTGMPTGKGSARHPDRLVRHWAMLIAAYFKSIA